MDSDEGIHIFIGQVVCVLGNNISGDKIVVSKIIQTPQLPFHSTIGRDLLQYYPNDEVLRIMTASGPFTPSDSLDFQALDLIISNAEQRNASVLVLLGPFIDEAHKDLSSCQYTFEELFKKEIASRLEGLQRRLNDLEIVLIPSQNDVVLEWVAYPQPPIGSAIGYEAQADRLLSLGLMTPSGDMVASLFPNPCQFVCNEVVVAISNLDSIKDILQNSYMQTSASNSKRENYTMCFEAILDQRHFYPIFPAPRGTKLDSTRALGSHSQDPCVLQVKPDVLIIPSILTPVIKNSRNCVCINPGYVMKGKSKGTFSIIEVHPFAREEIEKEPEAYLDHSLFERARVEILKL